MMAPRKYGPPTEAIFLRVCHLTTRVDNSLACALRPQFGQNLVPIVQCHEE
jgi:hypothetical protein